MTKLNDRFHAARQGGKTARLLNMLVRPSCLIIDEVGHCELDKENTRIFFDLIDCRYNKQGAFNMIFTSNKNSSKWRSSFNEDDALLCALYRILMMLWLSCYVDTVFVANRWKHLLCRPRNNGLQEV